MAEFETQVNRPGNTFAVAFLAVLVFVLAMLAGFGFVLGPRAPKGLAAAAPYLGLATLASVAFTVRVWKKGRIDMSIARDANGVATIKVGELEVRGPFGVLYGYERQSIQPGAPKICQLVVRVVRDDQTLLSLEEQWGAIYGVPEAWPKGIPVAPSQGPHFMVRSRVLVELVPRLVGIGEA